MGRVAEEITVYNGTNNTGYCSVCCRAVQNNITVGHCAIFFPPKSFFLNFWVVCNFCAFMTVHTNRVLDLPQLTLRLTVFQP